MRNHLFAFALIVWLAGCSSAHLRGEPNEGSPLFVMPVGSRMVLDKQVQIPAGQSEVYFQNGTTVAWEKLDKYQAYCALKVASEEEMPQVIQPDEFVVSKSYQESFFQRVQGPDEEPLIRPAAFGGLLAAGEGGKEYHVVADVMDLSSDRQPAVRSLRCTDWGMPQNIPHISLNKMRKALGSYFTIDLNY